MISTTLLLLLGLAIFVLAVDDNAGDSTGTVDATDTDNDAKDKEGRPLKCRHFRRAAFRKATKLCRARRRVARILGDDDEDLTVPVAQADDETKVAKVGDRCRDEAQGLIDRFEKYRAAAMARVMTIVMKLKQAIADNNTQVQSAVTTITTRCQGAMAGSALETICNRLKMAFMGGRKRQEPTTTGETTVSASDMTALADLRAKCQSVAAECPNAMDMSPLKVVCTLCQGGARLAARLEDARKLVQAAADKIGADGMRVRAAVEALKTKCAAAVIKAKKCAAHIKMKLDALPEKPLQKLRDAAKTKAQNSECGALVKTELATELQAVRDAETKEAREAAVAAVKAKVKDNTELQDCVGKWRAAKQAAKDKIAAAVDELKDECGALRLRRVCRRVRKIHRVRLARKNGCPQSDQEAADLVTTTLREKCEAKFDAAKCDKLFSAVRVCARRETQEEADAAPEPTTDPTMTRKRQTDTTVTSDELKMSTNCRRAAAEVEADADLTVAMGTKRSVLEDLLANDFQDVTTEDVADDGQAEDVEVDEAEDDDLALAGEVLPDAVPSTPTPSVTQPDGAERVVASLALIVIAALL